MLIYLCPVCSQKLRVSEHTYKCRNGHSFDISKKGYVNLLTTKGKNPALAGDNKDMIRARTVFLDTDAYRPLADRVGEITASLCPRGDVIDSGCGEGYYTCICAKIAKDCEFYGIDISKHGIDRAASRGRMAALENVHFAVGSAFKLPFRDGCADIVISTFAPVSNDEYARVLKPGGRLIVVSPTPRHLWGLKSILYEKPYLNEPNNYALNKFTLIAAETLEYTVTVEGQENIAALFTMTPYYYKTPKEASERLNSLERLETECGFEIRTFENNEQ